MVKIDNPNEEDEKEPISLVLTLGHKLLQIKSIAILITESF